MGKNGRRKYLQGHKLGDYERVIGRDRMEMRKKGIIMAMKADIFVILATMCGQYQKEF